jgi:hypothetical protein
LKSDVTFEILDKDALNQTDDQSAEQLQKESSKLFKIINEQELKRACKAFCFQVYRDRFEKPIPLA